MPPPLCVLLSSAAAMTTAWVVGKVGLGRHGLFKIRFYMYTAVPNVILYSILRF